MKMATKTTKTAEPAKAAKPTKAAKPAKAAKPTKAAKPAKPARAKKAKKEKAAGSPEGSGKTLTIRQVRGTPGVRREHREVLRGLGLRRPRHEVVRQDTPAVRGMLHKVAYLVEFSESSEG
jgi:large subunit ribosomal protein L30